MKFSLYPTSDQWLSQFCVCLCLPPPLVLFLDSIHCIAYMVYHMSLYRSLILPRNLWHVLCRSYSMNGFERHVLECLACFHQVSCEFGGLSLPSYHLVLVLVRFLISEYDEQPVDPIFQPFCHARVLTCNVISCISWMYNVWWQSVSAH